MTGGNSYHHAIRTVYRGTGFYAALAVIADFFVVAALISPYTVLPRRPAVLPGVEKPQLQPQTLSVPETPAEPSRETALNPVEQPEEAESTIEEKEDVTPENGQPAPEDEEPAVPPEKAAAVENFVALKNFLNIDAERGEPGRSYGASGGSCEAGVLAGDGGHGACLKLTYDVSAAPAAIAGYSGDLEGVDLSSYRLLTFQMKKREGREPFAVEISDGMSAAKVEMRRLLSDEGYRGWQTVTIPLEYFSGIDGRRGMRGRISVIFENSQGEPYAGTVFLRDIGFKR